CCPDGNALFGEISGGERRRVALCRLLLMQPNVLLLDEPTNHLDAQTVAWLEHHLKNYAGAVIMITHDRSFLDSITEWILELDKGQAMPFKGNYRQWLGRKIQDAEKSGKMNSLFHEIAAENDWIKIKSRNKASTEKATAAGKALRIVIRESAKLGRDVVSVKGVTYAREDRVLFDNIDLDLVPGGVFGVIGPNGAGKTTLLELLSGGLQQANGKITRGQTVEMLYAKQLDHYLDPKQNVYEAISDGMETVQGSGGATIQMRAYVAAFNFPSTAQSKRVSSLSGGERNRVYLARTLKMGCNVLLLDEPTNDLDVESIRALEEAILAFNGTVVVVSHDRWFLNRIATAILSCEGDGSIVKIDGNFDSYLEDRQRRLGDKALIPHKARYRKLVR
nr:ATP-binding cassette domain-containing protein [Alphaproteobacteria bacterium]